MRRVVQPSRRLGGLRKTWNMRRLPPVAPSRSHQPFRRKTLRRPHRRIFGGIERGGGEMKRHEAPLQTVMPNVMMKTIIEA